MKFGRLWFPILCLSVLYASSFHLLAFEIIKLVPVTTVNSVRIELGFRCGATEKKISIDALISDAKGKTLWNGNLTSTMDFGDIGSGPFAVTNLIGTLQPSLWSPATPTLYDLKVTAFREGSVLTNYVVRIGFRSFESRNGQVLLNGKPLFLRGLAINPPDRTIPESLGESRAFAENYVRFIKSQNVNIIRLTHDSQTWFDVCDELGMLVYQGQYGSPPGSERKKSTPPRDLDKSIAEYISVFEGYARHPSIVIYILSNEMPVFGARGAAYHNFLTRVCTALKQWDPTRLYIGNAGYGEGREGDICDVHRYWGWYYNTFLTYYNLRNTRLFGEEEKNQPITFSECVGNFTGPLGDYNLVVRKQLGAQLNWTGHSPEQREDALRYQAFMVKQAAETFRRLRPLNPRLSGLMPFTTLFYNWSGIQSFGEMRAKPAVGSLSAAYQPILLSWELWTPHIYAGTTLRPIAHLINDSDAGVTLTNASLAVSLGSPNQTPVFSTNLVLPEVAYYRSTSTRLAIQIPPQVKTGHYLLKGTILSGGIAVSTNQCELFIAGNDWVHYHELSNEKIYVYDEGGQTAPALSRLNVPITELSSRQAWPQGIRALVIGEFALAASLTVTTNFQAILSRGGHILSLRQSSKSLSWLPEQITPFTASANEATYPPANRPFCDNMHINPERPNHPVFRGLNRQDFEIWSDYSNWDETKPGFPFIYPVSNGFALSKPESLARTAILADYDRGLEGVALCEMFSGRGSVIVSGFDLVMRVGLDPVADRFLLNLLRYTANPDGHDAHPLIKNAIHWGDYASEQGVITGPANGFVVNADWVKPITNPSATPLTQEEGAWNTRPGDQFIAHGRRPFGPYGYSTGSSLKDLKPRYATGTGMFWIRIPRGKTRMTTLIDNRNRSTASLKISANQSEQEFNLPGGKTTKVSLSIKSEETDLAIRYQGNNDLVILETSFE